MNADGKEWEIYQVIEYERIRINPFISYTV